jgi:hypothetical protein
MKKLAILVVVAALLTPNQAYALFGLSKCDRTMKSIRAEEKIGLELWKNYRENVRYYYQDSKNNSVVLNSLLDVLQSDQIVWKLAKKNSKCFSSSQNAEIRSYESRINREVSLLKEILKNPNVDRPVTSFNSWYENYVSALTIIKGLKE